MQSCFSPLWLVFWRACSSQEFCFHTWLDFLLIYFCLLADRITRLRWWILYICSWVTDSLKVLCVLSSLVFFSINNLVLREYLFCMQQKVLIPWKQLLNSFIKVWHTHPQTVYFLVSYFFVKDIKLSAGKGIHWD